MPERIVGVRRLFYAAGSAGYMLTERMVINLCIFFYLPPSGRGLAQQVSQEVWIAGLTLFGAAMLIGRLFDTLADPFVANASDRSTSRLGRRRIFLLFGSFPMVLCALLLFWPPGEPESRVNFYWLAALLSLYFIAFTVYVAPYLALIPELAPNHEERVSLTTTLALMAFPVMGLYAGVWPWCFEQLQHTGRSAPEAFRIVVWGSAALAMLLCLLPIFAVDERRFTRFTPSELPLLRAMAQTIAYPPFLIYLFAQIFFIIGVNLIQPTLVYYAPVVLGRSEGFALQLNLAFFAATLVGFLVVNRMARRLGAKRSMVACVGLFALALITLALLEPAAPGTPQDRINLIVLFGVLCACGIPVAGFFVVPHVLLSQLVDRDAAHGGTSRAAMFFGIQGLFTKFVYGISTALLAFLFARFGNSAGDPEGVLLVGPIAGVLCLVSAALYALYPERRVLAAAREASG